MLIIGGSGQLGTAFRALLPDAASPPRADLDLARIDELPERLARLGPDGIINCAAFTGVDLAESQKESATRVNGHAVGALATYAADADIPFVTFSTDYVFDGGSDRPYLESDPPNPINAYGRSKLAGERAALAANRHSLIVRTSWVVSGTHGNFVATMLRLAAAGDRIRVVVDQVGCPTMADDLARATLEAMGRGVDGILHLTNQGPVSWHGLARAALDCAGYDPDMVEPVTSGEYPTAAARPAHSVLDSERLDDLGLQPLPHWQDSLPAVVERLQAG